MDQAVNVNGTLLLTCNVSGSEPISYQWLKDGVPLQDGGRVSGSNNSMLMVEPVEGNDFGEYQCNTRNEVDQVLSDAAMVAGEYLAMTCCDIIEYLSCLSITIIAFQLPSLPFLYSLPMNLSSNPLPLPQYSLIVVSPVIVNFTASPFPGVSQGIPLNLTCEAVGGPTLNVTWTTPTGPRVGSVIFVDIVTADDAGDYRCEVMSEAGTANDSITVRGEGFSVWEEQELFNGESIGLLICWCTIDIAHSTSGPLLRTVGKMHNESEVKACLNNEVDPK